MSAARLKYRVVKCSSEDPEFPVSELLTHSSQTKGWQTARFCDFPQEIGLQFETPVHLRQVQFLSHQSKIATKIDLYTALPTGGEASYEAVSFKRLGYLSLDSNERSQFQARELKSVYVDVSAQFIKILFHKCHVNRYNIVNQVGLIALNCLGEVLGPDLANGPPAPNPALRPPTEGYQPPTAPSAQDAAQAASDELRYDPQTLERIRSLSSAKARAVEAEDYEEAKRLKEVLARLRQTGLLLRELEDRKKAAVQNEDYDAAKALKSEIERLRSAIDRPPERPMEVLRERPQSGRSNGRQGAGSPDWGPPRGGHQPQMFEEVRRESRDSEAPSRGKDPRPDPPDSRSSRVSVDDRAAPRSAERVERRDILVAPPMGGMGGAKVPRTPPMGGVAVVEPEAREFAPDPDPPEERENFDAENHPLAGVPNVEDLSQPEPLHSSFQKEAELLNELFGEYLTRCVFSKTWNLRDAALQKLALDLQNGLHRSHDQSRLLTGFVQVLKRMVPDKNVQVFLSAMALLQALSQVQLRQLRRAEAHSAFEPLMLLLVERLGDGNARVDKAARDAHLCDLMRCPSLGAAFTAQQLLRPIKKKSVNPRVYIARLQLLASMVTEAGIQPESKEGLPLDPTVQLAMDWFGNANADVRENAVKLVAACYAHAGMRRIEKYLANIRQAQREIFDEEFDRVDAGDGLQLAQPSHRSAGSNRSTPKGPAPPIPEETETEDLSTCQFCGMHNAEVTQEAMDVHYWRECPMLTQCQYCKQVIEIATLGPHLRDECEAPQAAPSAQDLRPTQCPLCRAEVGSTEEDWRRHILQEGCAGNPRGKGP